MKKRYILDTCIWRDFYENRFNKSGNPIGEYAKKLFMSVLKNREKILFSEALFWELKKDYKEQEIYDMLNLLFMNKTLVKIEILEEEYREAKKLSQERELPFVDCLISIQARNHKCTLISRDRHIFQRLADIAKALKPEDLS